MSVWFLDISKRKKKSLHTAFEAQNYFTFDFLKILKGDLKAEIRNDSRWHFEVTESTQEMQSTIKLIG